MAKGDRSKPQGQAKPKAKRAPSRAVRGRQDDKASGGVGKRSAGGVVCFCPGDETQHTGPCWQRQWSESGYHKQKAGRTPSSNPLGMETGADNGQPIGASPKAEGGERAAGVSDWRSSPNFSELGPERDNESSDYDSGVLRVKGVGTPGVIKFSKIGDVPYSWFEQDGETKASPYRVVVATAIAAFTLGLLVSATYRLVLGS